ncbi:pyridoxamine 5'-phosphate oxidase family protein [Methanosphaera cuniculi]|uniref:pyridoxamine 5'-phosphate oxidase family protein n=1 Tax=Methanosphaera cuniculi TaxID=1077256 RepID=UPI0026F32F60|nr:pyridoxamine 5'-phosphate oxidase family protein [Methanosphaera cuniculi]
MITKQECLKFLRELIDVQIATVDANGNPQNRTLDIMHIDDETVYFLTARGKRVYKQITQNNHIALVGLKDNKSVRIIGEVEQLDDQIKWIDLMFDENKYMNNVYPGESRYILEPFKLIKGEMEFFDLTQKPIYRKAFTINKEKPEYFHGNYIITDKCIGCGSCQKNCPQGIILKGTPFKIQEEHCLDCGTCYEKCAHNAIEHNY